MHLKESLSRILEDPNGATFGHGFYRLLFSSYPELRQYFKQTEIAIQEIILTNSLIIVVEFADCQSETIKNYLELIGHRHALREIAISDYSKFRATLIAHLAEFFSGDWDEELGTSWNSALDAAIAEMHKGHEPGAGRY